ncbi:hypothetical protein JTB14_004036 [Gonioctena quinquepunctata]|nr:hypothetical protein JTB14_004036 [Gonioctena quinquepunctata]
MMQNKGTNQDSRVQAYVRGPPPCRVSRLLAPGVTTEPLPSHSLSQQKASSANEGSVKTEIISSSDQSQGGLVDLDTLICSSPSRSPLTRRRLNVVPRATHLEPPSGGLLAVDQIAGPTTLRLTKTKLQDVNFLKAVQRSSGFANRHAGSPPHHALGLISEKKQKSDEFKEFFMKELLSVARLARRRRKRCCFRALRVKCRGSFKADMFYLAWIIIPK